MTEPARIRGFSIVKGSWKSIDTRVPARTEFAFRERHQVHAVEMHRPGRDDPFGKRRTIALAVRDFPEPDSPTMAIASPRARSRSMPETIVRRAVPSRSGNRKMSNGQKWCGTHLVSRSDSQSRIRLMLTAVRTIIVAGRSSPAGLVNRIVRFS